MPTDEAMWQEWIEWLEASPTVTTPLEAIEAFRRHLLAHRGSTEAADRELDRVLEMMRTRTDAWRILFNNLYACPTPGFSTEPSPLVVAAAAGRASGTALDVATGQGRNALHLAQAGWQVTAIDISDEGLRVLAAAARRVGVAVDTSLVDADDFDFGSDAWDMIVMTYSPFRLTRPDAARRVVRALRPGGLLVVESFASEDAAERRRPVDIDPVSLRSAYADLEARRFEDVVEPGEWAPEPSRLVRFVAMRT